ncbi:hypothetical protein [Variovorax sp. DXTD-1]|uniref:hypothetical protein n=1 Tax=Variovorax sp. DXTD-1 TaxID=2495592 RepID=UPI000F86E5D0|nr:hypothetical protein [Variovorax sp. DXTD-1]RST54112.1 hypothetical protein EJI00_03010 [Variovorax sp. DXTD-1]
MDPELTQQNEQDNDAAFAAGFAGVAGGAEPTEAPAQAKPAAEADGGAQPAATGAQPAAGAKPEQQPNAEEQPRIAGLTETEVRTLLGRVPELESQLRKVNGKLGEYGGVIQELRKAPAKPSLTPERIQEIEAANPDIAAYVNARMPTSQEPATGAAPQPQTLPSQPDLQAELMDHFHEGWREKIGSQDFQLWLAAQPDDVRNTFNSTEKAKELSAVISKFDAWGAAKQTQQAKSSARLQNSLTPAGTPGKAKTALSDNDAFEAGFKSVRGL